MIIIDAFQSANGTHSNRQKDNSSIVASTHRHRHTQFKYNVNKSTMCVYLGGAGVVTV